MYSSLKNKSSLLINLKKRKGRGVCDITKRRRSKNGFQVLTPFLSRRRPCALLSQIFVTLEVIIIYTHISSLLSITHTHHSLYLHTHFSSKHITMAASFITLPSLYSSFNHSPSLSVTHPLLKPSFKDTPFSRFSVKPTKISPFCPVIRAQSAPGMFDLLVFVVFLDAGFQVFWFFDGFLLVEYSPDAKFYKIEAILRFKNLLYTFFFY